MAQIFNESKTENTEFIPSKYKSLRAFSSKIFNSLKSFFKIEFKIKDQFSFGITGLNLIELNSNRNEKNIFEKHEFDFFEA